MKFIITILRVAIGLLFIFSGLVKANDPLGLTYKMNEFFEVWNMSFMIDYTLAFSIAMIAFEIISGVAMIVGNYFRVYVTLLLLLNIFFTFLTAYALFSGKIKECGCFGDCIKISNTATFWKDVVLTIVAIFLYIYRGRVKPIFSKPAINVSLVALGAVVAFGFQWWVLHHLPYHDCLPFKVGNNILEKTRPAPGSTPAVYETTFIYEKDGVKKNFTAKDYPWQDSTWKYVDAKSVEVVPATGLPEIHDFVLTDSNNTDVTEAILSTKGYTYIWFLRQPEIAHTDNLDVLRSLMTQAKAKGIPFYVACSAGRDVCEVYQAKWNMKDIPFLTLDLTASKTAMRTNPGLMLLKDGVVQNKWSYLDYPKDVVQ